MLHQFIHGVTSLSLELTTDQDQKYGMFRIRFESRGTSNQVDLFIDDPEYAAKVERATKAFSDVMNDKAAPSPWDTEMERPYDASIKPTTTLGILMAAGAVKVPENPVPLDSSRNPDACGGGK